MSPEISIDHALIRGRYTQAVARMESVGVPVDLPLLERLRANWESIQDDLIEDVDEDYGVFEGRVFKRLILGIPQPTSDGLAQTA